MTITLINKLVTGKTLENVDTNGSSFKIDEVLSVDETDSLVTMRGTLLEIADEEVINEESNFEITLPYYYFLAFYPKAGEA